ncbi:sister-chromatid cohesion protein 3-like isoform X1 [Solanum stenotomum]|uniref:sister-chromatid cohesion protein 3-like isoform X1 n=1 Tax=Solanum stenotomum TaxID=172797 RepID=UPI0020D010CE|nr:sister-chromatid cohesion protein 3-like isoform X1 [Solanum stenotomum]
MHLHICYCLHSIINSGSVLEQSISSFISKRSALFELLEFFLTTKSPEGLRASQLACCVISEQWWLFRKATFASTEIEALGYSPDESILQKFWKLCERQLNIPGGSMFLFDWKVLQDFRKDGHHWRKKKDGETVNETREKMKVTGLCEKAKDILVQESNVQILHWIEIQHFASYTSMLPSFLQQRYNNL